MRVTVNVQPLSWGHCGTKHYLTHLLPELVKQSQGLIFNAVSDRPVPMPVLVDQLQLVRPVQKSLKSKMFWEAVSFPLMTRGLAADLVHIPFQAAMVKLRQPCVMTVHDTIIWEEDVKITERLYFNLVRRAALNSRLIITVSEFSKSRVVEVLQVDPKHVIVTPIAPSPDFDNPAPSIQVEHFRKTYGLNRRYIIYVGGTAVRKGIPNLVRAYRHLSPGLRAEYDLVIVGSIGLKAAHHIEVHKELQQSLNGGHIHLVGELSQKDLPAAYTGASAFVFPSMSEGFGLSPLEAMGCGTPALVSNRTSMPEVVGDAAILFDPSSVEDIASKLTSVLESAEMMTSLIARGFRRKAHFNWALTAGLTYRAYQTAIGF